MISVFWLLEVTVSALASRDQWLYRKTTAYSYSAAYKKLKISILFPVSPHFILCPLSHPLKGKTHMSRRNTEYKNENSKVKHASYTELKTSLHKSLYVTYNWCILLRLTAGFVNTRKWCSPRRSRGEYHFRGLINPDVDLNKMHELFCYMTIFSCLTSDKSDVDRSLNFARPFVKRLFLAVWQQRQKRCLLVLDLSQAIFNKQQLILANIRICKKKKTTTKKQKTNTHTHKKKKNTQKKTVKSSFSQIKKTFAGRHITIYFVTYRLP